MYNTSDNLEDLDVKYELLSFETVLSVEEHHQIFDEEFKDADFVVWVSNYSEAEKIKSLLDQFGYKAYVYDEDLGDLKDAVKIGFD